MKLKNTKKYACNKAHYEENLKFYLTGKQTVLAVDGGKGKYITAIKNAGFFSDMFTVINGLHVTDKYILLDIVVKSSNYDGSSVSTLFAEPVSEPIQVIDYKYVSTSWSGSDNEILINNEIKITLSSYNVQMQIIDSIPRKITLSTDSPFYKLFNK